MTNPNIPTIEYLRKRLRYEPETGKLFWLECDNMSKQWNSRWAGKEALASSSLGYKKGHICKIYMSAHRAVWAMENGEWPNGEIDHINGKRDDNRIENLRDVSTSKNQRNASKNSRNTSGICGVHWYKPNKKWVAYITINRKRYHLGHFSTIEEAAAVRAAASKEHGFTERHGT